MRPPGRAEHFPLFDAVRGLAILMVLSVHAIYQPSVALGVNDSLWRWTVHLDIAVPIFFCLSGFLIYRPFVSARAKRNALPDVREYAIRRVLRIVPGYWAALAVIALWIGTPGVWTAERLPRYLFFAHVYSPDTAIRPFVIGQSWTLDVEVVFYALVPLLAWLALRRALSARGELLMIVGLAATSWAWSLWALSTRVDRASELSFPYLLSFPAHADHFAAGMLLAVLSVRLRERSMPRLLVPFERWGALCWLVAIGLWVAACFAGTDGRAAESDSEWFAAHVLYGGVAAFFLLPGVIGDANRGIVRRRILRFRVFSYIGTVSYSFYLMHLATIEQIGRWVDFRTDAAGWSGWQWAAWWVAVVAGSTVVASIGFWLIERPCMQWRRRRPSEPPSPGFAGSPA